jgi:hypothetical protein
MHLLLKAIIKASTFFAPKNYLFAGLNCVLIQFQLLQERCNQNTIHSPTKKETGRLCSRNHHLALGVIG